MITELHKDDIFAKIAVHDSAILVSTSLSGCLHMNSRLCMMQGRVMNSYFSQNIVLVQFGYHMCIFVFNRNSGTCDIKPYFRYTVILKKVRLGGFLPIGNMLTVSIGPIQYS